MSARGQEFLRKQGLGKLDSANRTGEDVFHQSLLGATTNASQEYEHSRHNSMRKSKRFSMNSSVCLTLRPFYVIDKSYNSGPNNEGVFQLPSIGKGSPFKGFLDISIVTQKLRKNMHSQDGSTVASGLAPFEFGGAQKGRRGGSKPVKATAEAAGGGSDGEQPNSAVVKTKGTRFQAKDRQVQMSPKVLETWINETL